MPITSACWAIIRISAGVSNRGPDGLPVDAAVEQLHLGAAGPGVDEMRPPSGAEPGDPVRAPVAERGLADVERDEVVRAEERPDAELATQSADRAEREHAVAAGVDEPLHVRRVVDPVGLGVGIPVAGDQHGVTDIQAVDVVAARDAEPAAHLLRRGDRVAPLAEAAVLAR